MSNEGKNVKVHYTGTLDNGEKFDSSIDRGEPLAFVCDAGQMIPGFDKAVKDMKVGEKITVHIPAAEAYGEHNSELVMTLPTNTMPGSENLKAGEMVQLMAPNGQPMAATVVECGDGNIVFDVNHALAGKDLNFEIELISVD